MQYNSGIYKWLASGWIYNSVQHLVGSERARKWLAQNFWKCRSGEKIVDIGCGTGEVLNFLPNDVKYVGFDISEKYIKLAQERYDERAQFLVGTAHEFLNNNESPLEMADLVLCNGILHHLDDEVALEALTLAKNIMSPTGRFVCIEPTFLVHQSRLSKWITSKDRGRNVRGEQELKNLFHQVFSSFSTNILTGLIRIPYAHIIIECRSEAQPDGSANTIECRQRPRYQSHAWSNDFMFCRRHHHGHPYRLLRAIDESTREFLEERLYRIIQQPVL